MKRAGLIALTLALAVYGQAVAAGLAERRRQLAGRSPWRAST